MYSIYTSGNAFILKDNDSGLIYEGHSKDVLLLRKDDSGTIFTFKNLNNWSTANVLDFSTQVELTGAPYTDWQTFINWCYDELGKSSDGASSLKTAGFIDYNDSSTSSTPVILLANTWTEIPNDGLGAFTNKN